APHVSLPIDALTSGRAFGERYRIIRFIGHGGMGDVHEAEDLSLRHRVALKTIRAERAADALALERFRREALLARRVTHRNVCRVFDVGFHAGAMFLTMELLDGETLSARIKRGGRMSVDEALAIVEQIVAALGAAHRAGVVHRDLKCSNVMLCGDRVVVTDFGLAHDATAADHERSREGFAGSPAYVAPEQVNGQRISFAIDVYALGVVMYEMVTGQLPFVGATPMATAVMRLNEPPPSPRTVVPTLPAAWERTILRCLELKPADRFASAEDVLAALQSRPVAPPRRRQRQQRAWLAAIAATIGVAASAAGVVGWRARHHRAATATTTAEARRTLAIAEVADRSAAADDTWRATAIAELLAAQLEGGDALRVLPRATAPGREPAQLARQGATHAHDGELRPDGDGVTLSTRVVELPGGRVVAAADVSGPSSSLLDLAARAAPLPRRGLGLPAPTAAQATWTRSVLPTRPEAARRYSEGLTALRRFDPAAAQRAFAAALAVEPDQPIVHAAQAQAWHELESEERERQEAKRAFELSSGLPREQRLSIEAAYREAFKDWANAAELRMSLATFFPDNVDYGLALAEAQRRAGHNDEALATLVRLRRLPPPDGGDPRIDVAEANVRSRTDKPAALAAAKRAVESARQRGAIGVEADAHVIECTVEAAAAHVEPAAAACQQAIRLFGEQGNKAGIARATVAMVALYQAARRPAERDRWEQQALALYRELGSRVGEERVHMTMAIAYKRLGDYDKAEKLARGAVDFMRASGEP
ncbi:MAG: protein kinase domain-containing protein, partial [Polyangia bacterium]